MATIDNKEMILKIIANDGYYEGDPRVYMIVEYTNAWGNITYGVTWTNERKEIRDRYLIASQYIKNPIVLWKAD
jgi:hypothetical protein